MSTLTHYGINAEYVETEVPSELHGAFVDQLNLS